MKNIGILVSGGGSNLGAIFDAIDSGIIKNGRVVSVVSNIAGVYALERAAAHGVETKVIKVSDYKNRAMFSAELANHFKKMNVDLVVMAGFLAIVTVEFISQFQNRIINVHPSLIPSFCGDGYYGLKVHESALAYGAKVTGATVHFVNEIPDGGEIILQKAVAVHDNDTPASLQERVMREAEWVILPQAVELFCTDKLIIDGRRVIERVSI